MSTTRDDIRRWLITAQEREATHMIVATDTFDWSDYPAFIAPGEDVAAAVERLQRAPMTKVMEVYNLAMPIEPQLAEHRAFHL